MQFPWQQEKPQEVVDPKAESDRRTDLQDQHTVLRAHNEQLKAKLSSYVEDTFNKIWQEEYSDMPGLLPSASKEILESSKVNLKNALKQMRQTAGQGQMELIGELLKKDPVKLHSLFDSAMREAVRDYRKPVRA